MWVLGRAGGRGGVVRAAAGRASSGRWEREWGGGLGVRALLASSPSLAISHVRYAKTVTSLLNAGFSVAARAATVAASFATQCTLWAETGGAGGAAISVRDSDGRMIVRGSEQGGGNARYRVARGVHCIVGDWGRLDESLLVKRVADSTCVRRPVLHEDPEAAERVMAELCSAREGGRSLSSGKE